MGLKEKLRATKAREKEKMKDMTFKKKAEYIAGNWWLEILAVLVSLAVIAGGIYMIWHSTRDRILFVAAVDAAMTEAERDAFAREFKDYLGNTKRSDLVMIDTNVPSLGVVDMEENMVSEIMSYQQKSMTLIGTGLLDAYVCPEVYVEFLNSYNDLEDAAVILGPELAAQYADRMAMDGKALVLSEEAAAYFHAEYAPAYLVFTCNNHFPDVTRQFARFCLEK